MLGGIYMKVQKVSLGAHHYTWLVLDDDHLPIQPISTFLRYLTNLEKPAATIRAYANHLKLYWEFITLEKLNWTTITLEEISSFINWLRFMHPNVVSVTVSNDLAQRKASTVNCILGAPSSFYRYQARLGQSSVQLTEFACNMHGTTNHYKSLLHHVYKGKPVQKRLLKLRQHKEILQTLTGDQINHVVHACGHIRDQFLIMLLADTGLRIGQALALRHGDIKIWNNEIHIIYRKYNENEASNKTQKPNIIHTPMELMQLYDQYLSTLNNQIADDDFVFVHLYNESKPLNYNAVNKMFMTISTKVGFRVMPHMLRHTHATELLKEGWDPAFVQKRMGHASVQTTIDTYCHLDQKDLKEIYKKYLKSKEKK